MSQKLVCLLLIIFFIGANRVVAQQHIPEPIPSVPGIEVPSWFVVLKVADDQLATNVFSMTTNNKGALYVSGPGYIKSLVDTDGDGVFDSTRLFAGGPKSGAQGLCFDGNDLLATGDGGLLRYRDKNADGIADGPPEKIIAMKTGGEHTAHAIRKGPDGWWYVLSGNHTPILPEYYSGPRSPVSSPAAGFLMRFSPDWSTREIVAHGFRNAYDFDFDFLGRIYVYDSDGERDVGLPWYRGTRVFEVSPGDDAGWVSESWKRPSSYFDMPTEIGELGRGSPTGVVVNASHQFPSKYDDAIFVADWTFGRIVTFRRDARTGQYDRGTKFAAADGQFGFAVTDLVFANDGSLLVSVGGRGTQGAIYRIRFMGKKRGSLEVELNATDAFVRRMKSERLPIPELIDALTNPSQLVRVSALESLVGRGDDLSTELNNNPELSERLIGGLQASLESLEAKSARLILRILSVLDDEIVQQLSRKEISRESKLLLQLVRAKTDSQKQALIVSIANSLIDTKYDCLMLTRIGQLAMGGCAPRDSGDIFAGYRAKHPLAFSYLGRREIADDLAATIEKVKLRGDDARNELYEIGRLAAMVGASSDRLATAIAPQIGGAGSTATDDIHWLFCLSQLRAGQNKRWPVTVEKAIVDTLVSIDDRIKRDGVNVDQNFYPHLSQLARQLFSLDDGSSANEVARTISGLDWQVYLFDALPESARNTARDRFANHVRQEPEQVAADQIQVLASEPNGKYLSLIRQFGNRVSLLPAIISALSKSPIAEDRKFFERALQDFDLTTIKNAAIGLRRLRLEPTAKEVVLALASAKRLGWDKPSVSVRDQLMMFLQQGTGQRFGYRIKAPDARQEDVLLRWEKWAKAQYPQAAALALEDPNQKQLDQQLAEVDWAAGDAARGKKLYQKLQCAQCHDGGRRMGPPLSGITKRFGRRDIFEAIVSPNQQVPDRYRSVLIETVDGDFYRGSVVYESVDGVTLQEISGTTIRINQTDIESRRRSKNSLMPTGLLNQATKRDWADLFEFLKTK